MYWLYIGNGGCLWQMELDRMSVYGNSWVLMVDGTRCNGCK